MIQAPWKQNRRQVKKKAGESVPEWNQEVGLVFRVGLLQAGRPQALKAATLRFCVLRLVSKSCPRKQAASGALGSVTVTALSWDTWCFGHHVYLPVTGTVMEKKLKVLESIW